MSLVPRQNALAKPPPGVAPNYVDPVSRGPEVMAVSIALVSLAFLAVTLRLATKIHITKNLSLDDFFSVAALAGAIARVVISCILVKHYYIGRHIWDIPLTVNGVWDRNFSYIEDMIYLWAIFFAKMAILMLYYQIFRPNKRFRWAVITMMAVCGSYCMIFFFIYAFDCNPVHQGWTELQPTNCMPIVQVTAAIGGLNIATDLIIFIMPLPVIYRLQLNPKQKRGVLAVFATGAFVVATTIVREVIQVRTESSMDPSWTTVDEIIWLTVELTVGIICGCLPPLAPLYFRLLSGDKLRTSVRHLLSLTFGSRSRGSATPSRDNVSLTQPKGEFPKEGFRRMSEGNSAVRLVDLSKGATDTEILGGSMDHDAQRPNAGIGVKTSIEQGSTVGDGSMVYNYQNV